MLTNRKEAIKKLEKKDDRKGFNLLYGNILPKSLEISYINNRDKENKEEVILKPDVYSITNDVLNDVSL
jgi:hypothetical protein